MTVHTAAGWWDKLNWGTVPDWFVAAGTIAAFLIAAIAYAWNVSISRRQQARKVSLGDLTIRLHDAGRSFRIEPPGMFVPDAPIRFDDTDNTIARATGQLAVASVDVHNGSDEVMGPIEVALFDPATNALVPHAVYPVTRIQPRSTQSVFIGLRDVWHPHHPALQARIVFRDSAGRWWQRFENESIRTAGKRIRPTWPQSEVADSIENIRASETQSTTGAPMRWHPLGNGRYISLPSNPNAQGPLHPPS